MSQERQYIPEVNARVKLATFSDYASRSIPVWAWLLVKYVEQNKFDTHVDVEILDGDKPTGIRAIVPLSAIDKPLGWEPRYTIHVSPEELPEVLQWLKRGIVVRQSAYIGDGSTAFQPMDNAGTPHWKYPSVTDTIPPELTRDLIRVVKVESRYDAAIPAPCAYCVGGKRIRENNPALTPSTDHCAHCGAVLGFSYEESWHDRPLPYTGHSETDYCKRTYRAGDCWCCKGTGVGVRYLSSMEPKERKRVIAQLEKDGWEVWYQRRGAMWRMERKTVVKDFGQEVK